MGKLKTRRVGTVLNFEKNIVVSEYIGKKKDGFSVVLSDNAEVLAMAEYKNDKLNGTSSIFLNNGLFREVAEFKNDKKEGVTVSLSGDKLIVGFFKNDKAIIERTELYGIDTSLSIEEQNKIAVTVYNKHRTVVSDIPQNRLIVLIGYHDPSDLRNVKARMEKRAA